MLLFPVSSPVFTDCILGWSKALSVGTLLMLPSNGAEAAGHPMRSKLSTELQLRTSDAIASAVETLSCVKRERVGHTYICRRG